MVPDIAALVEGLSREREREAIGDILCSVRLIGDDATEVFGLVCSRELLAASVCDTGVASEGKKFTSLLIKVKANRAACRCSECISMVTELGSPMTTASSAYEIKLVSITWDSLLVPEGPASLFVSWMRVCITRFNK